MKIYYNPALKEKARELRNNSTLSEVLLWKELKKEKINGYDFHRQKPIDNYIVDFFCFKLMLAIEVDGESHIGKEGYDRYRQEKLESFGIRFLRFDDMLVKRDIQSVVNTIRDWIERHKDVSPNTVADMIKS
jgi:very-short-patch-repair endonuclease